MKKAVAAILAVALVMCMTGCALGEKETNAYTPSQDIEVCLAFVDREATVVTKRLTEKELKSVELACMYYTASGYSIGEYKLLECTFSTYDKLSIWNFEVPSGSVYMEATVAAVTYADGKKEACAGISDWAQSKAQLDVKAYEKSLQEMKKNQGAEAENCPAAAITLGALQDGKQKLEICAGEKAINSLVLYALWFDQNGVPLDCNGIFVINGEKISSGGMQANATGTYSIEAPKGAAKAKVIVQQVIFADETVWDNPYVYQWAFVNSSLFE